jgi:hypothetical protein
MNQYPHEFVNSVADFYQVLLELHNRDPEQELQGASLVPYNSILKGAKIMLRQDEMIQALPEIITADNIENEMYPRVADTLVVISQIWSSLGTGRRLPS